MSDIFRSVVRNVRVAPRKARLVVDLVRGKEVSVAVDILRFTNKKTAPVVMKALKSAIANARKTGSQAVDIDRLFVKEISVDEGQTLKRYLPRAQGRATPVRKRSSHITVKLAEF